jgi:hypothetical protein
VEDDSKIYREDWFYFRCAKQFEGRRKRGKVLTRSGPNHMERNLGLFELDHGVDRNWYAVSKRSRK